jgi:GMP synthase (glutamine-hydrolysing)
VAASSGWRGQSRPRRPAVPIRFWLHGLPFFEALCSHIDEIERLPPGAEVLAQNELCPIQALAVELPSGATFFGTQYHPEFTLAVAAGLIELRAADLVAEGFGRHRAELVAMARDFRALHADPERHDLAWRYGIGPEILDPVRRTSEIGNWLREAARISSS